MLHNLIVSIKETKKVHIRSWNFHKYLVLKLVKLYKKTQ